VKRPREPLAFHFPHYQGDSPHSAILSGHMKLLHFYETGENHLFDLQADIGETKNLAAAKPEIASSLAKQLAGLFEGSRSPNAKAQSGLRSAREPAMKGGRQRW